MMVISIIEAYIYIYINIYIYIYIYYTYDNLIIYRLHIINELINFSDMW